MRKLLFFTSIIISLSACHKDDDVTPKDVSLVESIPYIHVAYGTEFSAIPLPATVAVAYSDGNTTEDVAVSFSAGTYTGIVAGTYVIEGTITPGQSATNTTNLKAIVHVVVSPLKMKTVKQDDVLLYEYFYDTLNRLDHFHVQASNTDYYYTYVSLIDNKVTQRVRKLDGNDYPEKYTYSGSELSTVGFYHGDNILDKTYTYIYTGGKISRYDNSDQSIDGLKFRTFEYDANNDVKKVAFDFGNSWNYTYVGDKKVATPLVLDLADPQNQEPRPIATFSFVPASTYSTAYTYNDWDYPTQEVRTYTEDGNKTSTFKYTYE